MSGLLAELRRRNVIRAAGLYLVGAWLIVQVAGTVLPMFGAPGWVPRTIVILLVLGFVPVLVIAWIFELTPEGLKRDAEVPPDRSIAPLTARRMDRLMIAGLAVAALLLVGQWFLTRDSTPAAMAPTPSMQSTVEPPHSIAVLPFVNMSQDKDNEHFGDGLSEELLNLLTQVPGLRVAARTSSFHFKGKDATIAEIAAALQVDTVLEGSVRRSGSTMRVVAQLISAQDGSHLWSGKYDRELDDIFAVQDDIAAQILKALRPRLAPGEAQLPTSAQADISAELFERFLWARNLMYDGTRASADQAHAEFLAITKAAPKHALGHAWLARSWLGVEERAGGAVSPSIALPAAQAAVDAALLLDPQEAMAHYAQGLLWRRHDDDGKALVAFEKALALNPALVDAYLGKQHALARTNRVPEALQALEAARGIDPLHPAVLADLAHLLNLQGRKVEAFAMLERMYHVVPARAAAHEIHLYFDNLEWGRAAFVAELEHEADKDDVEKQEALAALYRVAGLHDRPAALTASRRHLSLARLGRREEALAAMRERLVGVTDPQLRTAIEWKVHLALGDAARAQEILLQLWGQNASRKIGFDFDLNDALALAVLLHRSGELQTQPGLVEAIEARVGAMSELHNAGLQANQGYLAMLQDRADAALEHFGALADAGWYANWGLGPPLFVTSKLEADPRFKAILARIVGNRDAQVKELERLRNSGMGADEARAEYLAKLAAVKV